METFITKPDTHTFQKPLETKTYGWHLILDCYGANPQKLHDIERIFRFLDTLPAKIDMQKIGPPQIACFDDAGIKGITGIVMIVTSHISMHTYSNRSCFFMDVFSCKEFDAHFLIKYVEEFFEVTKMETQEITRGHHFPTQGVTSF